jgi:hypothetical protein
VPDALSASTRAPGVELEAELIETEPELIEPELIEPELIEPELIEPELIEPELFVEPVRRAGSEARSNRRWLWVFAGVLVVLRLAAAGYLLASHTDREDNILGGDAGRYHEIAESEGRPYRDVDVEYPPVALALIELTNGSDRAVTIERLVASQLILDLAVVGLLVWAWDRRTAFAYLILSTPLLAFPFLYMRIDLLSVFLALLGLALVRKGWDEIGGTSLAVAVYAKVWPLVVMPVLIIERKVRAGLAWAVALVACGVAWVVWGGMDGPSQVLTFRGAKGWQTESIIGLFFHASNPSGSHPEAGAWRTAAEMAGWHRPMLTALSGLTVLVAWWLASRRRRAGDHDSVVYGLAPMVCVIGMLVFAPILSPQYVLWFLPFAAIVAARGNRTIGVLTLAVTALSAWSFATIKAELHGQWYGIYPLFARNGLLVAMLVVGLVQLARPVADDQARAEALTTSPSA